MIQKGKIKLLDSTLRDGGLCLEDAWKNNLSNNSYSLRVRTEIASQLQRAGVEIVELGSIEISQDDKRRFAIYQSIEDISRIMPAEKQPGQEFAALYRGPDTPLDQIPSWKPEYCKIVRVIIRYSELQKSLDFCAALKQKGYCVFIQPMLTMRYSADEIQQVISAANNMDADAVYFVDSYGYMQQDDVYTLFQTFDKGLHNEIPIGFHAHNNLGLAFANVQAFLQVETERVRIVDSCAMGIGQGAGNLQTEVIAAYLNQCYGKTYQYGCVLDCCENVETVWDRPLWGFSTEYLIPAIHKTAYKYSSAFRHQYGLRYRDIDKLLANIPDELRYRYTPDNAVKLLRYHGYQV